MTKITISQFDAEKAIEFWLNTVVLKYQMRVKEVIYSTQSKQFDVKIEEVEKETA